MVGALEVGSTVFRSYAGNKVESPQDTVEGSENTLGLPYFAHLSSNIKVVAC